jgi:hypothetical protein
MLPPPRPAPAPVTTAGAAKCRQQQLSLRNEVPLLRDCFFYFLNFFLFSQFFRFVSKPFLRNPTRPPRHALPMVLLRVSLNSPLTNCVIRFVFPTPESPTTTILYRRDRAAGEVASGEAPAAAIVVVTAVFVFWADRRDDAGAARWSWMLRCAERGHCGQCADWREMFHIVWSSAAR